MKHELFLLTMICISMSVYADITLEEVNLAQMEYQFALNKYDSVVAECNAQIEPLKIELANYHQQLEKQRTELSELKPKSLKAKNLTKKMSKTEIKIAQLESQISELQSQIEMNKLQLLPFQQAYEQISEQYQREQREQIALSQIDEEYDSQLESIETYDLPEELQPNDYIANDGETEQYNTEAKIETNTKESKKDDGIPSWLLLTIIFIGIIIAIRKFRRNNKCPNCGHYFTLKSQGDVKVWDRNSDHSVKRKGVRKRYICSHCGEYFEYIDWELF